jgi:hypothetical protein
MSRAGRVRRAGPGHSAVRPIGEKEKEKRLFYEKDFSMKKTFL